MVWTRTACMMYNCPIQYLLGHRLKVMVPSENAKAYRRSSNATDGIALISY